MKKIMTTWELIETNEINSHTQRMLVPGGWVVERWFDGKIIWDYFVEDPDHIWLTDQTIVMNIEGVAKCNYCENTSFLTDDKGGHCLACKRRFCSNCGEKLTTEDMTEKCLVCEHVNEWIPE
ncbi:hypothetical protein HN682_00960 [Candidatus Peregrinibacteria bacterium]|jgi:hypothetical protein|nr:hypothetical protein [Candidatus Peregrinibacteria bacterium]